MSRTVRLLALGSLLMLFIPTASQAQQPDQPRQPRQGFGFGGGAGNLILLQNEAVQKELELVDDQIEKLNALREKSGEGMRELFSGLRDLSEEERREKFAELRETMEQRQKDAEAELNNILLPQQRDRLKQLTFQMQNRFGGGGAIGGRIAEELGITEEQREKLRTRERELMAEVDKKTRELRAEARAELLKELTPEQQAKYKELVGEQFDFPQGAGGFGNFGGGRRPDGQGGRGRRGGGDRGGDSGGDEGGNRRPEAE
jgi:Spy/CpxP family protein refolding chaperone